MKVKKETVPRLTEEDRAEMLALSQSESLRSDARKVADGRHNPFMVNGEVNLERVVEFLTQYNEFLNHPVKPFRPWIEKNMKL
jgi:hypothetical protein